MSKSVSLCRKIKKNRKFFNGFVCLKMELKPYSDLSERFCVHNPDFGRQYYEMYRNRLKELTVYLRAELIQKWENKYPIIESAKKLANEMDQCVLIGTIFKNQKLKPSILKQIMNFHNLDYEPVLKDKLLTDTDSVILESNDCRYNLIGEYDFGALVTGVSCAVLGKDAANGCFIVDDCCFIECRPQIPRPQLPRTRQVFVLFASGLNLADSSANLLPFRRFIAWLKNERSQRNNRYFHLVLAGNSLSTSDTREPKITLWSRDKFRDNSLSTAQEFDKLLHELLDVCDDVSLMPGQWDPADVIFPQQPIHKCLLPAATNRSDRLHLIPNPANFEIFETQLLGTSGQNIDDIWKYSNSTSVIEILKNLLKWSHLAPTCPDTLPAYPIDNRDPFVIDNCPHVLFAGNQKEFACERFHGPNNQSVQLLSIPAFDRCFSIVQMSLETLDCELKSFAENL